jgi:hypothetical protein
MAIRLLNTTPQRVSWLLWAQPVERRGQGPACRAEDAALLYQLPEPRPDGQPVLSLTPMEFLERLATLIPSPLRHCPSSHAILAPPFCWEQNGTALAGPERTDPRDGVRDALLRAVVTAHAASGGGEGSGQGSSRPPAPAQAATEKSRSPYLLMADHSFMLLARSGRKNPEVLSEVLDALAGWISTVSHNPLPSDQR